MSKQRDARTESRSAKAGSSSKKTPPKAPGELGALLVHLVNSVSHRGGATLSLMNNASVTLPQVIILARLLEAESLTSSDLAEQLNMSLPSVSQMVERLFQLELLARVESSTDRRQKRISLTSKGHALIKRIQAARAAEYEQGIEHISGRLKQELKSVLTKIWNESHRPRE